MRVKTFARVRGGKGEGAGAGQASAAGDTCVLADHRTGMVTVWSKAARTTAREQRFAFDGAFGRDAGQSEVFECAVLPLVTASLQGINSTLFAYGQTGSGKTFSCTGGASYDSRGVIPRAISAAFEDPRFVSAKVSYVEVYNEEVLDLLNGREKVDVLTCVDRSELGSRRSRRSSVHMKNVTELLVRKEEEALDLFFRGNMARSTGSTSLNLFSSRSHCVFIIELQTTEHVAKLNMVDLAGSERTQDTTSKHINLSLHFLEQVVMGLQVNKAHVGFRNSAMTALLRESLCGNSQTAFLVTLHPEPHYHSETISSCRFAQRCRSLSTQISVNETMEQKVARLERENSALRRDLGLALEGLREHDKVREMLQDMLARMDQDACDTISCEAEFLDGRAVQVDIDDNLILVTPGKNARPFSVPRASVTAIERSHGGASHSVLRVFGRLPTDRKPLAGADPSSPRAVAALASPGHVLFELEYRIDGTMLEQVAWLQSFEHWLGPDVAADDRSEDLRPHTTFQVDERQIPGTDNRQRRSKSVMSRAITVFRDRIQALGGSAFHAEAVDPQS